MKAEITYRIHIKNGTIETSGVEDSVCITKTKDPVYTFLPYNKGTSTQEHNEEPKPEVTSIQLSPSDARELAEMLIRSADHADSLVKDTVQSHKRDSRY